jgi:hypothetical protein
MYALHCWDSSSLLCHKSKQLREELKKNLCPPEGLKADRRLTYHTLVTLSGILVSVLAIGPKNRGFKSGQERRIFNGKKSAA